MISEDKLAELKAKHGAECIVLDADDVVVVCRKMTRAEWRKFLQSADDKSRAADEAAAQFRRSVLSPPVAELEKVFDEDPVFETDLAGAYFQQCKSKRTIEAKKT